MATLQKHIAAFATESLMQGCKEVRRNSAPCIDEMRRKTDADIGAENWCATFVFSVLLDAWKSAGNTGALPLQVTPSTRAMIAEAQQKKLVTSAPQIGDVFYRHRGTGGHVGIIIGYSDDATQYYTIEGNANNRVGAFVINRTELNDPAKGYAFIDSSTWIAQREFSGSVPRIIPKQKSGGDYTAQGELWLYASNPVALILLIGAGVWAYKKLA